MDGPLPSHDSNHCNPLDKNLVSDLKNEIISELPKAMMMQKSCPSNGCDSVCRLNTKLLQYFLQQEFIQPSQTQ